MLTSTFIHIQGIGVKTEQKLWGSGCTDWSCLSPGSIGGRPFRLSGFFIAGIEDSIKNNVQDTINLEHLLVTAYNMKAGQTPFAGERQLPEVVLPENPFGVDVRMVEEVQRSFLRGPFFWD